MRRRRRTAGASLVAAFAVLCAVSTLAGSAGATPHGRASGGTADAALPGSGAPTFASRAGYSPQYLAEAVGAHPATGAIPVEVTFSAPLVRAAYAAALAYFRAEGLTVTQSDPDRLTVALSGTAAATGAAFSTQLLAASYHGSPVLFPGNPPSLPAALEAEVGGVVGLSSGFTTFSFGLQPSHPVPAGPAALTPADSQTMTPALAREFYGFSSLYNLTGGPSYPSNLSIAVVLWGAGYAPSDIGTFLADYYPSPPFPQPRIAPYPVAGAPYPNENALASQDPKAVEELTLDVEWAMSMAPGATIDVVYAPDGPAPQYSPSSANLTRALSKAVSLDPAVISMSFGTTESTDSSLVSAWTPLFQQAASNGTTILAATGDTGGDTTACSGTPAPEYPASSPQVVAVGGTNVAIAYPLGGGVTFSETAWNDSGGGFSTQFAEPSWQKVNTTGAISANGHRGTPDVSATAGDNFLYFDGTAQSAGGTSFATPLWAGLVADLDAKWQHQLGFFTPSLYHVGANELSGGIGVGLADVVGGANCVANATSGWDAVTGWGSPRAAVLYDDLLGSFVNIALTADRTTVAPGGSVSVTAQLTNRTSGVPIANVPVDLTIGADTDIGPCTGPFQSTSPTTNATGWVSAVLSVPFCYLGAHALINASVTTTTLYGTNGLRIGVNLLGFVPGLAFLTGSPWAYVTYSVVLGAAVVGGAWIGRPREPAVGPTGPPAGAVASGSTPGPPASPAPPGGALPSRPPTAPVAPPPPPSPAPPPAPPGGGPPPPRSPA